MCLVALLTGFACGGWVGLGVVDSCGLVYDGLVVSLRFWFRVWDLFLNS